MVVYFLVFVEVEEHELFTDIELVSSLHTSVIVFSMSLEDVAVVRLGNWCKHTASLISSLCSSVNWFCSSRSNRSFSARSRSRSRRAFSRCCWVVEAPKGAPRVRSGSLPRLEV